MFIQTQQTPNPATVKFLPGQSVIAGSKTFDFASVSACAQAPLAARLFQLTGVVRVFLAPDFVSVTKAADTDWAVLKPMILAVLMDHLSTGQPVIHDDMLREDNAPEDMPEDDDELVQQIKALLDERVRPMVAMDGGDIIFDRFEDGIVYLHMHGACSGCPSSTVTLKSGIENMLRYYVPEVLEVRQVSEL